MTVETPDGGVEQERILQRGIELHGAGELGDAARCYQAVLEVDPGNVDALYLMSVLAAHTGHLELAERLAREAIAGADGYFAPYIALGNVLQQGGALDEAEAAFRAALVRNPQSAEAECNLSSVLNAKGCFDAAATAAARALVINPDFVEARNNLGNALMGQDAVEDAAECYALCVAANPDFADSWSNLGAARTRLGDGEGALEAYARALQIEETPDRLLAVGVAFLAVGQFEPAARCFAQILELDGRNLDAWNNLAVALKSLGRLAEAEAVQRDAVALAPDDAEIRFNLALLLLQQGKWREGWAEYEHRWGMAEFRALDRGFVQPGWDGAAFPGQTLLITAEQGFGDAIQFSRFIALAAERGGRVVVECRPELRRLLATAPGCAETVVLGDALPPFDLHVPMMSLPRVLGLELETLPAPSSYLGVPAGAADFADVAAAPGLRVGLVWAGKASRGDNVLRSCSPGDLAPLLALDGASFFSLQVGGGAAVWPAGRAPRDLSGRLGDFADTAAAVAALDLVIVVDTAVAHLAGALGKPAWVMLPRPCNGFLWMDDRTDSPWYPTARLFRQAAPGDWAGVVAAVRDAVIGLCAG